MSVTTANATEFTIRPVIYYDFNRPPEEDGLYHVLPPDYGGLPDVGSEVIVREYEEDGPAMRGVVRGAYRGFSDAWLLCVERLEWLP